MADITHIIDKLFYGESMTNDELAVIISCDKYDRLLFDKADAVRQKVYGKEVYIRGLIEISSYCKNNCYYCGIRAGNKDAERYRLTPDEILSCCRKGHELGFRTFVLQGGEDDAFNDDIICSIVRRIKSEFSECAVTLSLGEKSYESFAAFRKAGADRYLLRHETACEEHYRKLHPADMDLKNRKKCLFDLKSLGFQTGAGFMVGSPFQTVEDLVSDIRFLEELKPEMIGIGPFIHHCGTPFADWPDGSVALTLRLLAILRLMFPEVLLPATTALGTLLPDGRERGLKAGANVVMPNLSPVSVRKKYSLYENKICTGEEAAECLNCLKNRIRSAGFEMSFSRGDYKNIQQRCT